MYFNLDWNVSYDEEEEVHYLNHNTDSKRKKFLTAKFWLYKLNGLVFNFRKGKNSNDVVYIFLRQTIKV